MSAVPGKKGGFETRLYGKRGTGRRDGSPHARGQEGVLEGLLRQRDSSTPLCYVQNDMLVEMPERCRRFLGRRAGLKPASTGRGGRGGGMCPRIREDTEGVWVPRRDGPNRGRWGGGYGRNGICGRRRGWVPASARTTEVGGRPGGTAPTGEGMGPHIREDTEGMGGHPGGTAPTGEGWGPASARTRRGCG